ncbi:MAG: PLP-dependent aminotransferase family protein [Oscillospiraceae bacterium]|nr:PLP-dependent aminotransferase family protein [Oscillospiraceae bacterium]
MREYKISDKMVSIKPSAIREIFKALSDPSVISFAAGNPSPDAFPLGQISELSKIVYEKTPVLALQYGITEGYAPLVEKIRLRMKDKFNIDCGNDTTIIVAGGQQGIDLTSKVMCDEGDVVLCEKPTFIGALNAFKANGAIPVQIESNFDGISIEKLEKALIEYKNAKIIYLIPTFQNPSGSTLSLEKRRAVLALAKKYGVIILEDNPYGELRFRGEELPTLKSLDNGGGSVVYCSSFSKIIAPAIRVGYLSAPSELASKIIVAKQVSDVHTNIYFQLICDLFLERYNIDEHIEKIRVLYKDKCLLMLGEMNKKFGNTGIKYTEPDGGLFLWCDLPESIDLSEFVKLCLERKAAVVPGGTFLADEREASRSFRVNFSYPSNEQIIAGVDILARSAMDLLRGQ